MAAQRSSPLKAGVRIVEVGPRDGLQNIKNIVPTSIKVELIERLSRTGLRNIEATSFVSPKWIPQLADGRDVMHAIEPLAAKGTANAISFQVLVPNLKGLEAAQKAGVEEIGIFVSASEGFSKANINCTIEESLVRVAEVAKRATASGLRVRGYVSCIFSCPYDGPTDPSAVLKVTKDLLNMGCYEVSLGDTLGVGTPAQVRRLLGVLLQEVSADVLGGHFHDTYGQAVANTVAAYDLGLRVFDSSVSGLGGCPYSPGAKGNLASEDIVYTFEQMGIPTGVDLGELVRIGEWIAKELGIPNGSRAGAALFSKLNSPSPAVKASSEPKPTTQPWTLIHSHAEYLVHRRGPNVKITLNRPKNGNAMTTSMVRSLTSQINALHADKSIFRIVITANGKFFCTGMDLSSSGASAASREQNFADLLALFQAVENAPQTTIALVNGSAFGGGVGLAFACDVRLTGPKVAFRMTETRLGLCPAIISKYVFREWGLSFAREAMLSARPVSAQELLQKRGAVHGIAPEEDASSLDSLLDGYLDNLKAVAPNASAVSKELAKAAWKEAGSEEQDRVIRGAFDGMMTSEEARIGMENFRKGVRETDWGAVLGGIGKAKL